MTEDDGKRMERRAKEAALQPSPKKVDNFLQEKGAQATPSLAPMNCPG
jgi:hypothetical protein